MNWDQYNNLSVACVFWLSGNILVSYTTGAYSNNVFSNKYFFDIEFRGFQGELNYFQLS